MQLRYDQVEPNIVIRLDAGWTYDAQLLTLRKDKHMKKPVLNLRGQDDNEFSASTTGVVDALTTNAATFPALAAATTLLSTKLTTFKADLQAVVNARTALQAAIAAKNNSRADVE